MLPEKCLQEGRLCVVGNINRDLKTAPFTAGASLLQDGETPVDSITETIGGGGANSAFAAAALGAKVAFLGKVGADALGDSLEQALIRAGITAGLARDAAHPTGTSLALAYSDGQRHFVSCQPNNASLKLEDLDLGVLTGFTHLLRADIWFSESMLFEGNLPLFQAARSAGLQTSIDLNWDPLWGRATTNEIQARKSAVKAVLPWVSLAHGNIRELNEFTDSQTLDESLRRLEAWGVRAVVVHMGDQGAGYYQRGQLLVEPPAKVSQQVNSTGTGDVLSVCMMLSHRHPDVRGRLELANGIVAQFMEGKRQLIPSLVPD